MDGFPSGQRGQTVNLLATPSKVRILLHPFDKPVVKQDFLLMLLISIVARGGAVWKLVGLITRRSQVQILPPQLFVYGCSVCSCMHSGFYIIHRYRNHGIYGFFILFLSVVVL